MQTYTQKKKRQPFDWNQFLRRAKAGKTTKSEEARATNRSASWVTCACGNQCAIIPRGKFGDPKDATLRHLGVYFCSNIESKRWHIAIETLKKIEARSNILIKREKTKALSKIKQLEKEINSLKSLL